MSQLAPTTAAAELGSDQSRDKITHPLVEFWYFFRMNRGAVIGLAIICFFMIVALFAPFISPHDPTNIYPDKYLLKPSWVAGGDPTFWLGTDDVGRDLLSRLAYGARVSMGIGFLVVILSLSIGTFLGLISGFFGGILDRAIMRSTDILMSLPSILLAIVVVSILGPSLINTVLAVSIVTIPSFVRLVRSSVQSERVKQYVIASRCYGASPLRLIFVNILPNCMAPLIVQGTLGFSDGILNAAALGFLGLGTQPPTPEWGTMLADSRAFFESAPWLVTLPGLCILVVVLGFNLLGDGLRDAFDPRLRR